MEKTTYERRFHFYDNHLFKLLIIIKISIVCLLFTTKAVIAVPGDFPAQQQNIISGIVTDSSTGEPLIGVSVVVKGTTIGVTTNTSGEFAFSAPDREVNLTFSYIGYLTHDVRAVAGHFISVTMMEDIQEIEQVVIVGYGVQKKESVVGAITQVENQALVQSGLTNVTNAISGKLSGVLTIQQTGEPGADHSEIIIRGLSSWNSSAPLTLVDGVERDFKNLDPNEINTISVLKDASATAVFGARGANGVIIVTTKRGSMGKPKFDFSAAIGGDMATRIPDHISSYTTMSMLNVALMNQQSFTSLISDEILEEYRNPSTPLNALRYPNVNWFKELTTAFAPTTNANLNVQGGTNFVKYFCSLGYTYQGSFFKNYNEGYLDTRYKNDRFNYRGNVDFSLTKSTLLSLNLGGDINIKNQPTTGGTWGIWGGLYGTSPSRFPAYFPAWVLEKYPDPDYPDDSGERLAYSLHELRGNPYSYIKQGAFNRITGSKLFTDLILDQQLDFILKGLSAKGKVALSTYFANRALYSSYTFPEYQFFWDDIDKPDVNPWYRMNQGQEIYKLPPITLGVGAMEPGYYSDLYYEMSLNYNNTFGNHRVTGLALLNRQEKSLGTDFPYYNEGLVGRLTYDYKYKYLLEVNVGYTGSERFAPGNRFGFFPSGALGWIISEEKFLKNTISWMNKLKLRYSDGLVGSDYANNRWLYISDFKIDSRGNIVEDAGANSSAQWEEARKRDIGVEMGIKNFLNITIDFFDEQRSKMLLEPQSVTPMVGNTFKELNLGKMKKHGIELEAEYYKTLGNGLNYFVKGIFGFNENRIIFKDDPPFAPDYYKQAGKPLGSQVNGVKLAGNGWYNSIDEIHIYPSPIVRGTLFTGEFKFIDYNADGEITTLDKHPIKGNLYPPITYSLASGFSYKGFDFHFLFAGNLGKYVEFNLHYEYEFNYSAWRVHASHLDYWRPDNHNANHSNLHYTGDTPAVLAWTGGNSNSGFQIAINNQYWRNADYLRLKDIYAGYTFHSNFLKNTVGISDLLVYATGNNLITFTKLIEGDPERKDFYMGFYPIVASAKLGLKFIF